METTIKVRIKTVYGNTLIYPICDKAKIFAELKGQKTLTSQDIARIKSLGYSVVAVAEEIAL